jgi:hypothetical protein
VGSEQGRDCRGVREVIAYSADQTHAITPLVALQKWPLPIAALQGLL